MDILVVIDMQNDFIDGALGTKEAQAIVKNVAAKIREYQTEGNEIIFTRDTHGEDYLDTPEGKKLPVKHCIKGTKGWEIADGLYVDGSDCIDKPNFGWPHWNERSFEEIELVGLYMCCFKCPYIKGTVSGCAGYCGCCVLRRRYTGEP